MGTGMSVWTLTLILSIPIFFLPTIIAIKKQHPHKTAIIICNIIGGLFWGLGWLIAIIWCFISPGEYRIKGKRNNIAGELEKLHELKEKSVLTEEEYLKQKEDLLKEN